MIDQKSIQELLDRHQYSPVHLITRMSIQQDCLILRQMMKSTKSALLPLSYSPPKYSIKPSSNHSFFVLLFRSTYLDAKKRYSVNQNQFSKMTQARKKLLILYLIKPICSMLSEQSVHTELEYRKITQACEEMRKIFLSGANSDLALTYITNLTSKIKYEQEVIDDELVFLGKGRGGNSVAENVKKCFLSLLKKHLPKHSFRQFERQCIIKHNLKSQKENAIIFSLYLQKFSSQGLINPKLVEDVMNQFHWKLKKYAKNSKNKVCLQEERRDFHLKNMREFEKYIDFDLDFKKEHNFEEVASKLQNFYLRKKVEFEKAKEKLKNIILQDEYFLNLFPDLDSQNLKKENNDPELPQSECPCL